MANFSPIIQVQKTKDFGKYVGQGRDVIEVLVFPGTVGAERDRVLFRFRHLCRGELRAETKRTGELSLHLVRSSSVLKYSSA